jgi:hypothetical protein
MTVLYTELMDALYPVCPDCLFLIEGSGQSNARINWGDGFIADEAYIDEWNISNPNVFLTELLDKPYVKQGVPAAHVNQHLVPAPAPALSHTPIAFSPSSSSGPVVQS